MIPIKAAVKEKEEGLMKGYEEEVRAFFVSITRPKHKLHIIQAATINGKVIAKSPFVEIVKNILKQQKIESRRRKEIDEYVLGANNSSVSNYNNRNK